MWFRLSNCFNARQSAENVVLWNEYSVGAFCCSPEWRRSRRWQKNYITKDWLFSAGTRLQMSSDVLWDVADIWRYKEKQMCSVWIQSGEKHFVTSADERRTNEVKTSETQSYKKLISSQSVSQTLVDRDTKPHRPASVNFPTSSKTIRLLQQNITNYGLIRWQSDKIHSPTSDCQTGEV